MERMTETETTRRAVIALAALAPALVAMRNAPGVGDESNAMPADLAQASETYHRATIGSDVEVLAGLVADDYLLVNSDSSVQDKPSYLADFRVPGFRLEPYVVEEPFHRLWDESALIGGSMRLNWVSQGERQSRHLRFVHAWTKRAGQWRLAFSQLTRIPD